MSLFGSVRRRAGGLFDADGLERMLRAQAIASGDYATAAQINARSRDARTRQEAAQAEAEEARSARASQAEAAAALGYTKEQIAAMRPEDLSQLVRERFQTRQFGSGGGSVYTPGTPGAEDAFIQAPSRHEYQGSVFDIGPDGAVTPRHQGRQIVPLQPGGEAAVFNSFTGDEVTQPVTAVTPPPVGPPPTAPRIGQVPNEAALRAAAERAIRQGADPAQVNQRLEQMLTGGAGPSGPRNFP